MSTTGINLSGMNLLNGQGVNVSTLVSQLVTAAKVPETQWQDQQTNIKSQISDLKVLNQNTSTLANDVNSLKDSAGAVTSRTVTTSDSSLVSATAAAGSAVGTHTVLVKNLATTSSYYTDQVASANTQIATGSFAITVGGGPANVITIDSTNNTLSGLADAINQKNMGVTASVITDANGARLALVSQSSGAAGDLNISNPLLQFTNSNASTSTWTSDSLASADAVLGQGTINLSVGNGPVTSIVLDETNSTLNGLAAAINNQNLGVTASIVSDASGTHLSLVSQTSGSAGEINISSSSSLQFSEASQGADASANSTSVASATTSLGTGTFTVALGTGSSTTITVDSSNNTLSGLAASINQRNIGVTASVVTDSQGAHLSLVSQIGGTQGNLTLSSSSSSSPLQFIKAASGTNASLTVDGVPVSSASNTVTGAVAGLTLNLNGADQNAPVNVSVSPNTVAVIGAITSFVNDFNTLVGNFNQEYTFNSSTKSAGPLSGDSTLQMLQSTLLNSMGFTSNASAVTSLSDFGIKMNNDGTLTLDNSVLTNVANNRYDALQKFLQGDGAGSSGFASSLSSQLENFTDATNGAFTLDINGRNASVKSLQNQIDDFETYLTAQQAMWTAQYVKMNVLLQTLPAQLQQIQAALGNKDYANS